MAREPIQGLSETVVLDTPGKRAHPQDAWANWWSVPSDYPGLSSGLTRLREPLSTGSHQLSYSIFTVPVPEKVQPSSPGERSAKQWRSRSPPSCQGPGSAKQWRSRSPPSSEGPGSAKQWRSRSPPSCQGPGSAKQWKSRSLGSQTVFPGGVYPVPKWTPVLDTPKIRAHPCRSLGKLVDDSRSTEYCSGTVLPLLFQFQRSPPSSQSPRSTTESDHIGLTQKHKFQFRIQTSPITSIRLTSPVPVKVQFPFQEYQSVPDSAIRVRSHRSDSFLLFSLRFQVSDRTEINYFSWWTNSRIQNPSSRKSTTQVPLRSSGRFFTDLPRRPTLRTVRISVLRQNL